MKQETPLAMKQATQTLEQRLARVFGLGLSAALLFLAIGVFIPTVLWLGIAALMFVPLAGAVLVWQDSSSQTSTKINIALALAGVLGAVVIGLLLRR